MKLRDHDSKRPKMARALIVGATRGLGACLASQYASKSYTVFGTSRSESPPQNTAEKIQWITGVDVASESAGSIIAKHVGNKALDIVIINAGYFATESFDKPDFQAEIKMYSTSAIGPVFIVHHLYKAGALKKGSKVILISSESGSITLRHSSEGGGNYGHHASKAASNMVGKLLSLDLEEKGVAVGVVHVWICTTPKYLMLTYCSPAL